MPILQNLRETIFVKNDMIWKKIRREINDGFISSKSVHFHDIWIGADTPGRGEAAFAVRFEVK